VGWPRGGEWGGRGAGRGVAAELAAGWLRAGWRAGRAGERAGAGGVSWAQGGERPARAAARRRRPGASAGGELVAGGVGVGLQGELGARRARCVAGWKNGDKGEREGAVGRGKSLDLCRAMSLCRAPNYFAVRQKSLPCVRARQRIFAVPISLCRAPVHDNESLPCATARQRVFSPCESILGPCTHRPSHRPLRCMSKPLL
jgi:hypothetical protein